MISVPAFARLADGSFRVERKSLYWLAGILTACFLACSASKSPCKEAVLRHLKAPATAEFTVIRSDARETVGWVDAENSYGANIRNGFVCEMSNGKPRIAFVHDAESIGKLLELNRQLEKSQHRLVQVEPVFQEMKEALASGDSKAYEEALRSAEELGVVQSGLSQKASMLIVEAEIKVLQAEVKAATAGIEVGKMDATANLDRLEDGRPILHWLY